MQFEGIYTPIVTPYHADYTLNQEALAQTVELLIGAGVHGIIVAGTTGEYYAQTTQERLDLMAVLKGMIAERVAMVVGTGAIRTEECILYAQAARRHDADAILVATPPYACPTDREIALHCLAIDRAADLPVMLYNYPGRMGVNMGPECLDRLSQSVNFCVIKESSGDPNRLHMLARDYPQIALSCGMDDQALEFFAWGARSWVCAGSNFAPEAHIAMYRACVIEGDFAKGRALMLAMLPLMAVLEQGGTFVQCIKHGLSTRGIDAGPPRKPLQKLNKKEKRNLDEIIHTMNKKISEIQGTGQ